MTLWGRLCCAGYGIQARAEAFVHLLRGHNLRWRGDCFDWWTGHTGCIVCEGCPDTSVENGKHVGCIFWCRTNRPLWWLGRTICGWLGHPELRHPQRGNGREDAEGNPILVDVVDEWYCYRCLADVEDGGEPGTRTLNRG